MTITEFCKGREVDSQAVRRYIERHPEEFENHTGKKGRETTLDEEALRILEQKYPLAKPVQIINGVDPEDYADALRKIGQLQETIIMMQNARQEDLQKIAAAEASQMLLEEKSEALRELKEEYNFEREKRNEAEREAAVLQKEVESFKKTLFGLYKKV